MVDLAVRDPRWCAPRSPDELSDAVVGRRLAALERRGKYLDWALEGEIHLVMHLRMTGSLLLDPPGEVPHTRKARRISGPHPLVAIARTRLAGRAMVWWVVAAAVILALVTFYMMHR